MEIVQKPYQRYAVSEQCKELQRGVTDLPPPSLKNQS